MSCSETASFKDRFGYPHYHRCHYKVYCYATFRAGTTGELVTKCFCKKHYNALVKNCARVEKLTGFKSELHSKIIELKK